MTEDACKLHGLCRLRRRAVQEDHEQVPRSDVAAVRAVDGSYRAERELIHRKLGKMRGLSPLKKPGLYAPLGRRTRPALRGFPNSPASTQKCEWPSELHC